MASNSLDHVPSGLRWGRIGNELERSIRLVVFPPIFFFMSAFIGALIGALLDFGPVFLASMAMGFIGMVASPFMAMRTTHRLRLKAERTAEALEAGEFMSANALQSYAEERCSLAPHPEVADRLSWTGAWLRNELGYWVASDEMLGGADGDAFITFGGEKGGAKPSEWARVRIENAIMNDRIDQARELIACSGADIPGRSSLTELRLLLIARAKELGGFELDAYTPWLEATGATATPAARFFRGFVLDGLEGPSFREGELEDPEVMLRYLHSRDCLRFCVTWPRLEAHRAGRVVELRGRGRQAR
jgi:hypothetical protein